jgi:hypothetical protein
VGISIMSNREEKEEGKKKINIQQVLESKTMDVSYNNTNIYTHILLYLE